MYETLCGEPWCWTPQVIGELTDYQVWELVLRPALRRAREFDRKRSGSKGRRPRPSNKLPDREEYVQGGMLLTGAGTREHWEREYDKFVASQEGGGDGSNA